MVSTVAAAESSVSVVPMQTAHSCFEVNERRQRRGKATWRRRSEGAASSDSTERRGSASAAAPPPPLARRVECAPCHEAHERLEAWEASREASLACLVWGWSWVRLGLG